MQSNLSASQQNTFIVRCETLGSYWWPNSNCSNLVDSEPAVCRGHPCRHYEQGTLVWDETAKNKNKILAVFLFTPCLVPLKEKELLSNASEFEALRLGFSTTTKKGEKGLCGGSKPREGTLKSYFHTKLQVQKYANILSES